MTMCSPFGSYAMLVGGRVRALNAEFELVFGRKRSHLHCNSKCRMVKRYTRLQVVDCRHNGNSLHNDKWTKNEREENGKEKEKSSLSAVLCAVAFGFAWTFRKRIPDSNHTDFCAPPENYSVTGLEQSHVEISHLKNSIRGHDITVN